MTLQELQTTIVESEIERTLALVSKDSNEIKVMFHNLQITKENNNLCGQLIANINRLLPKHKRSKEIQFLVVVMAFYFKKANKTAYITTCLMNLDDSILKNRLLAWHQYKKYTQVNSHIDRFEAYVTKLTNALSDENEDYIDDILLDIHNYKSEYSDFVEFQNLFQNELYLNKFVLLREYQKRKDTIGYRVETHDTIDKIYTPSVFSGNLFNDKFMAYIKNHPKTNWHQILLGYDNFTIRSEIIKFGQANFDSNYCDLLASDVVKLYCYFNMRKHFYTSLYLFERCSWLRAEIEKEGCTKFIDIGCGPATSGLALIDYLQQNGNRFIPFDYIGVDYYQSMLDKAADIMNNGAYQVCNRQTYVKNLNEIDREEIINANAVIINTCYLFASPSLDIDRLANEVNTILNLSQKPRFLLFQNTTEPDKNVNLA